MRHKGKGILRDAVEQEIGETIM